MAQNVDLYISIYGDNPADIRALVLFDITNDIQLDSYTEKELDKKSDEYNDYNDIRLISGVKINEKYYYQI